jgi:hypothetical protein
VIDPRLKEWATETQAAYVDAVIEHGSQRSAAKALGIGESSLRGGLERLKRSASLRGYSPAHDMTRTVPDTHVVKGVSTYYDSEGKVAGQWVKSSLDNEKAEQAKKAALEALAADLPRLPPSRPPAQSMAALCNVYTLTDSHVGSLCWGKEAGADWDLKIAEATLAGCFAQMIQSSPMAHTAVVAQLGDFLHQDGISPVTPTSGHVLDADGRFTKVVQVAVRLLRRVVDMALASHQHVIVLMAEGNHDISSSIWLRTLFAALYENEPRVTVIDSPLPYYVHRHGQTMLAWHHGHLRKPEQLPILFAAQFPQEWGTTTKRYAHTGHRHHVEEKEHSGMKVFQHPTLTARDAYAARGGWLAERQVTAITYHDAFGEVGRVTITPEMLA